MTTIGNEIYFMQTRINTKRMAADNMTTIANQIKPKGCGSGYIVYQEVSQFTSVAGRWGQ